VQAGCLGDLHALLGRRSRGVRERAAEVLDHLAEFVDRPGRQRSRSECAVELGLPGVHDDRGTTGEQWAGSSDGLPRPVRAVVREHDRAIEPTGPLGHDEERQLGVVQEARRRRTEEGPGETAPPAGTAHEDIRVGRAGGLQKPRPSRGPRAHRHDVRLEPVRSRALEALVGRRSCLVLGRCCELFDDPRGHSG
jgi:hypothetical protein